MQQVQQLQQQQLYQQSPALTTPPPPPPASNSSQAGATGVGESTTTPALPQLPFASLPRHASNHRPPLLLMPPVLIKPLPGGGARQQPIHSSAPPPPPMNKNAKATPSTGPPPTIPMQPCVQQQHGLGPQTQPAYARQAIKVPPPGPQPYQQQVALPTASQLATFTNMPLVLSQLNMAYSEGRPQQSPHSRVPPHQPSLSYSDQLLPSLSNSDPTQPSLSYSKSTLPSISYSYPVQPSLLCSDQAHPSLLNSEQSTPSPFYSDSAMSSLMSSDQPPSTFTNPLQQLDSQVLPAAAAAPSLTSAYGNTPYQS